MSPLRGKFASIFPSNWKRDGQKRQKYDEWSEEKYQRALAFKLYDPQDHANPLSNVLAIPLRLLRHFQNSYSHCVSLQNF